MPSWPENGRQWCGSVRYDHIVSDMTKKSASRVSEFWRFHQIPISRSFQSLNHNHICYILDQFQVPFFQEMGLIVFFQARSACQPCYVGVLEGTQ